MMVVSARSSAGLPQRRSGYDNDKTMTIMAEQSTVQGGGPVGGLVDMAARLVRLQLDMMVGGLRAATSLLVPVGKASVDMSLGMLKTFSRVLDGVSSALAPKQAQAPRV